MRISQANVNDFEHKSAAREKAAEAILGSFQDAGVYFIHVKEHEAWKPAFDGSSETLVELAKRYAPNAALMANGGLHDAEHANQVVQSGADIIAIGKAALANPDHQG